MVEKKYKGKTRPETGAEPKEGVVFGRNAVRELIVSGRPVDKIIVRSGPYEGSLGEIIAKAKKSGVIVSEAPTAKLDAVCGGANHQGIVAFCAEKQYASLDDVFALAEERGEAPFIVICDGIEDPHNLGAIIRTCECAGVHGVVIPNRRSCTLTTTVAKTSAGAVEHMNVVKVTNLADTVEKLKKRGVWIYACEVGGEDYFKVDFSGPCAIILGSEGEGVGRLLLDRSDFKVSIPMWGKVNSLNVSTAAAVVVMHASRGRHGV
jgi:23S rRNA (guanosine2251-2'-O)-methyltransferase